MKKKIIEIINSLTILLYIFAIAIVLDLKNSNKTLLLLYVIIHGFYWFYRGYISKTKE